VIVGECAGKERCVGGEGGGYNRHVLGKENGFSGETVKMRGAYPGITVTPYVVGPGCVQGDKDYMPANRLGTDVWAGTEHQAQPGANEIFAIAHILNIFL